MELVFVDAEFTVYEKDVLLKLPRKEYILFVVGMMLRYTCTLMFDVLARLRFKKKV